MTHVVLVLLSPVGPVGLGPGPSVSEGLSGPVGHMGALTWNRSHRPGEEHLFQLLIYVTVMKDGVVGLKLGTGWLDLGGSIYVAGTWLALGDSVLVREPGQVS